MFHSIGLYRKNQIDQANARAEELIQAGALNVHIEIVWTEINVATLGRYLGFYVNHGAGLELEPKDHCTCSSADDCCAHCYHQAELDDID